MFSILLLMLQSSIFKGRAKIGDKVKFKSPGKQEIQGILTEPDEDDIDKPAGKDWLVMCGSNKESGVSSWYNNYCD